MPESAVKNNSFVPVITNKFTDHLLLNKKVLLYVDAQINHPILAGLCMRSHPVVSNMAKLRYTGGQGATCEGNWNLSLEEFLFFQLINVWIWVL